MAKTTSTPPSAKQPILYPFLISIYPVIALYAHNLGEVELSDTLRSFLLSLVGGVILLLLLRLVAKRWDRAALLSAMLLVYFFSYGHLYQSLKEVSVAGVLIGRHRFLLPLTTGLLVLGCIWALKRKEIPTEITRALNWVSVIAVALPLFQIVPYEVSPLFSPSETEPLAEISLDAQAQQDASTPPDIYYIILDAYGRADTLQALYGYDNQPFVDELSQLGFYVAECSQSNYPQTKASLASALNMDYEENIWDGGDYNKDKAFIDLIQHSRLRQILESHGYITVSIKSGIYITELRDATLFLTPEDTSTTWLEQLATLNTLNAFEEQFFETTLGMVFNDIEALSRTLNVHESGYLKRRAQVLFALDQLSKIAPIDGPKFVFVHIVSPHRPFVFGPNGEEILDANGEITVETDYATGYTNQVTFLNSRLIPMLEQIIQESDAPPVIILQGDHGPAFTSSAYRSTNLNAYYLPEGGEALLYSTITPVNSFRIVLNYYLGYDFELLEDIHYQSSGELDPEEYPIIQNIGAACTNP